MSFFGRLFGRKPAAPDLRVSNDWRAGDLAVCIAVPDYSHWLGRPVPNQGEVCRVTAVYEGVVTIGLHIGSPCFFLRLEGYPHGYSTFAFRKAVEDTEPAEAEFTALIKRRKQVKA